MSERGIRHGGETVHSIPAGSRLRPLRDQIVVRPLEIKLSETIIADWSGKPSRGEVIAVGPGHYPNIHERGERHGQPYHTVRQSKHFSPTQLKPGDIVQLGGMGIGGYLFQQIGIDGVDHVICREADVCLIEEPD
ncbi:GroES chaperonin family [uncultured Caudovirales phage]|uniref:GroES chaperonin family n=1 Tax=uncultured Caudovirales phage TaxID=2100421 RepID=A0A6J5KIU6_9CAUD|nr:GroES chaperonin family [uncultured Caudovirales phage]CAB5170360.1 GroES chaperonin family [uncultured Caudovirales phage]